MSTPVLFFKSVNPTASKTLLLLHGSLTSHHEWDLVCGTGILSSYHLLIPDLPGHGSSTSASISFNLPDAAALLADLVSKHGKNGKADVVGMSLGGYMALFLADKYPDIIGESLFLSGCGKSWPRPGFWKALAISMALFWSCFVLCLPNIILQWFFGRTGLQVNDELIVDVKYAVSYRLGQNILEALHEDADKTGKNWKDIAKRTQFRTCVVAGVLEDREEDFRATGECLKRANPESGAFKVEGKKHAWDLQDPHTFALGIKAWVDHEKLPGDYINIRS